MIQQSNFRVDLSAKRQDSHHLEAICSRWTSILTVHEIDLAKELGPSGGSSRRHSIQANAQKNCQHCKLRCSNGGGSIARHFCLASHLQKVRGKFDSLLELRLSTRSLRFLLDLSVRGFMD